MTQVSKHNWEKYFAWTQRGKLFPVLFTIAILLPGAPDDIICLFAGLTKIKWYVFLILLTVAKPFSIALYSFGFDKLMELL